MPKYRAPVLLAVVLFAALVFSFVPAAAQGTKGEYGPISITIVPDPEPPPDPVRGLRVAPKQARYNLRVDLDQEGVSDPSAGGPRPKIVYRAEVQNNTGVWEENNEYLEQLTKDKEGTQKRPEEHWLGRDGRGSFMLYIGRGTDRPVRLTIWTKLQGHTREDQVLLVPQTNDFVLRLGILADYWPISVETPGTMAANAAYDVWVELNAVNNSANTKVLLEPSNAAFFSSFPGEMWVPRGHKRWFFSVLTANMWFGSTTITAVDSDNQHNVTSPQIVAEPVHD